MKKHIFAVAALGLSLGFTSLTPAMAAQVDTQSMVSEISETGDTQSNAADSGEDQAMEAYGEDTQYDSDASADVTQTDAGNTAADSWTQTYGSMEESKVEETSSAEETSSESATEAGADEDLEAASVDELNAKAAKKGWVYENGHWFYYENGTVKKGWVYVGKKWYYLQSEGRMVTGWQYLNWSGGRHWFYFDGSGAMKTGWQYLGWSGGRNWFYFNGNGAMLTGWQQLKWSGGTSWFYFNSSNGAMAVNTTVDGYKVDSNGARIGSGTSATAVAKNGWVKNSGSWYYYKNGKMLTGWQYLGWSGGKHWFYFDGKGVMKTGWQYLSWSGGKNWFYFGSNGNMLTGWQTINGKTYYLNSNGAMLTGTQTIDGKSYSFNSSGALVPSGNSTSNASGSGTVIDVSGLSEKEAFIKRISTYVSKYASSYGIKVKSPIIAQAILESGWGKSGLSSKYHNYFGMKCGSKWTGKAVNSGLSKVYPAGSKNISSCWRVYDSMEEGVKGYFEFINTKRYQNLKGVTDPKTYLERIRSDGYCSSGSYVSSLMKTINTYNLTQYDK